MKRKRYIAFSMWLPMVLAFIAICLIVSSASKSTSLPSSYNAFGIMSSSDKGYIRDFELRYQFGLEKGNLSFRFFPNANITEHMEVDLPRGLNVSNFSVKNIETGTDISENCYRINGDSRGIMCNNLIGQNTFRIILDLKGVEFYPNGVFTFYFPNEDTTLLQNTDIWSKDLLTFDLGGYRCSGECFIANTNNPNITYSSNQERFRVYILPQGGERIGRWYRFVMSTYNSYQEKVSSILLAIGISILSGSIFFALNFLKECLKEKLKINTTTTRKKRKRATNKRRIKLIAEVKKGRN